MRLRPSATLLLLALCSPAARTQFVYRTSATDWMPASRGNPALSSRYEYDDGSSEALMGLSNGGEFVWMTEYNTEDRGLQRTTICVLETTFGSANMPGQTPPPGTIATLYLWEDTDDDNDPRTGLVCLYEQDIVVTGVDTDIKQVFMMAEYKIVEKRNYVGFSWNHAPGQLAAGLDQNSPSTDPNGTRRSWFTGNISPNGFDCTNLNGPGSVGVFEMDAIGMPGLWLTAAEGTGKAPLTYCTAKQAFCGLPAIDFNGLPEAGAASGFRVFAGPARANRNGFLLYSLNGPAAIPFQGGLLCIAPPFRRTVIVNSRGATICDGEFSIDFNSFATGNLGGNPDPALLIPCTHVNAQYWGRDSLATGTFLSDGLDFDMM